MRIGTRIHTDWLGSDDDHDLKFLKQIGVDYVDITLDMVKGYTETGCFEKSDLLELIDRLEDSELKIERANSLGPYYRDAHTCGPNAQQEIDNLCKIVEMLGEVEVPVFGIQCCQASISVEGRTGWTQKQGRGGYGYPSFDLKEAQGVSYEPEKKYTAEQLWEGLLNIYRQVIPVAESSGTNVAMHGNDPPLYEHWGNPQILCRYADFDRLFQEVPSDHNTMTFCVGTRYESGEDIFEGIRHFGGQNKIKHVHFRNVRGTLPSSQGYAEVFLDDGDMDMNKVVHALHEVDYEGVIDFDHVMTISGDTSHGRQYIGFSVGYMRGLLAEVGGEG